MALRPPDDFTPSTRPAAQPGPAELRRLWERHQATRRSRERNERWRDAQRLLRRDIAGGLHPAHEAALPAYLRDRCAFGPDARTALRPVPPQGRVRAAGIDTWSPCWYAEPASPLARAMRALATWPSGRAFLLPEPLGTYRVGWFPEPGLVFAEGRPGGEALTPPHAAPAALRRLDVAGRPLWADSAAYRTARRTESVLMSDHRG